MDEAAVNFDFVQFEIAQLIQTRISGTDAIERNAHAGIVKGTEHAFSRSATRLSR
jgi:hypothetical protein